MFVSDSTEDKIALQQPKRLNKSLKKPLREMHRLPLGQVMRLPSRPNHPPGVANNNHTHTRSLS